MRKIHLGLLAGVFAGLTVLFAVGCGGVVDQDHEPLSKRSGKTNSIASIQVEKLIPVTGKYEGVIEGVVKWGGEEPDINSLTKSLHDTMKQNKDFQYCLNATEAETVYQSYRIGVNKNLGNVFVWIAAPAKHAFKVDDGQLPKSKEVMLSQPHCAFVPHCVAVFVSRYDFKDGTEDPKGCQKLVVQNDASVGHNAKMEGGPLTGSRNETLGPWSGTGPTLKAVFDLKAERDPVKISCGVHGWMNAWARAYDHPYFAISSVGADHSDPKKPIYENLASDKFGTFKIVAAPIGAKVRLFAWHEELGHLLTDKGVELTIDADPKKNMQTITAKRK